MSQLLSVQKIVYPMNIKRSVIVKCLLFRRLDDVVVLEELWYFFISGVNVREKSHISVLFI